MPISMDHAFGRGMVSPKARAKALSRMKGSASMGPAGKMAGFDSSRATDAHQPDKGTLTKNEINKKRLQRKNAAGVVSGPTKGGAVNRGGQPTANAINESTGKKYPVGAEVRKGNARYKSRGNSGGSDTNGPVTQGRGEYYGSKENNRYG